VARIEHEVTIERPVSEVFAFVAQPDNLPTWQESCLEVKRDDEGPVAVGTTWTERRSVMNREMEQPMEAAEYETDRRFTVRSVAGPTTMRIEHTFEPVGAGTRVAVKLDAEFGGFAKLAGPMVRRQLRQMFQSDLARLKEQLES